MPGGHLGDAERGEGPAPAGCPHCRLTGGGELIVIKIDRLGRSTSEVIMFIDELTKRGIALRILAMPALDIMASFAAHERRRTRRRQEQGIAAAKVGRQLGRPRKLDGQQVAEARARIAADVRTRLRGRCKDLTSDLKR